jgi:ferredoxin
MRCAICNAQLNHVSFNRDHGDIDPCGTCLTIIREVFPADVDEKPDVEIEPTPEEMMADAEDLAYGKEPL